jgi:hypothetical protein
MPNNKERIIIQTDCHGNNPRPHKLLPNQFAKEKALEAIEIIAVFLANSFGNYLVRIRAIQQIPGTSREFWLNEAKQILDLPELKAYYKSLFEQEGKE